MKLTLDDWQQDAFNSVQTGWSDGHLSQCCIIPTGGGKTVIFSTLTHAEYQSGRRILILVNRDDLVRQTAAQLRDKLGIVADIEKAEARARHDSAVVIASIQTLSKQNRLESWPAEHFDLIIIDECDQSLCDTYLKVARYFWTARLLGFTATPARSDGKNIGSLFKHKAYEIGMYDRPGLPGLISRGRLCPIRGKSIPINIDISGVKMSTTQEGRDFNATQLGHAIEPYFDQICLAIKEHASDRKIMVFQPVRETSKRFVACCIKNGIRAMHVDGATQNRDEIKQKFRNHEFQLLSNVVLLNRGYDDPTIDCIVVLRLTGSTSFYTQMIGRGTRVHPLKTDLLILDFLWHHKSHRICRPACLITDDDALQDEVTKRFQSAGAKQDGQEELDLGVTFSEVTAQREKKIREALIENSKKKAESLTAAQFAESVGSDAIKNFVPTEPWQRRPITPSQHVQLKRAKIDPDTVQGTAHAGLIIDAIHRQSGHAFASEKTMMIMRRMRHVCRDIGIDPGRRCTSEEAGRFFAELRARKSAKENQQTFA